MSTLQQLEAHDEFIARHIGPNDQEMADMLSVVGQKSVDALVAAMAEALKGSAVGVRSDSGEITGYIGTITDITERKIAETRVFEEKERAQVTLQSIGDGVITTDAEGRVDYINPVAQDLTGLEIRHARGRPIGEIMTIVNEHTRATVENPVLRCLREGRVIALAENSVLLNSEGNEIPIQDSAAPIRDRIGNVIGAVMVFHDVSRESRLFRQLSYQASHDSLTGLINRREFENRLVKALENSYAHHDRTHALLYVDLDQFCLSPQCGFASRDNLAAAKALGVRDMAFHKKRGLAIEEMVKSRWVYRKLRNFRAGIEAGISCLKRGFGLARCTWRGLARFKAYVWSAAVAYNLALLARLKPS